MNYCPFCGKQIEDSYKHCPFCGAELNSIKTTGSTDRESKVEGIKEDDLINILTNSDTPVLTSAKPIPIQRDILNAINDYCRGIKPEPKGDLIIDGMIRIIPDLIATFMETVYDLDYEEYSVWEDCRKGIYNDILNQIENDKQEYPSIDIGKKALKKSNLTQPNFAALYCLKNSSHTGSKKLSTEDIRYGQSIDSNYIKLVKYVRLIAMREACKKIKRIDLKLTAACYWYTYYSSELGLKGYEAEVEGRYTTKYIVTSTGERATNCIRRNDALCEISRQLFESALNEGSDEVAYEINENEANQLITKVWNNITVYATKRLGDIAPSKL